jgi:hypothetical protein
LKRRKRSYRIEITHEADEHLSGLSVRERTMVLDSLEACLAFEPTVETR